jgi:23S rRNA (adenine2503-C2)-methyltransferase
LVDFLGMSAAKQNLLGLTREELGDVVEAIGEPRYRGRQIFGWLYSRGATSFRAMTDLGKAFRERLEMGATITGITPESHRRSRRDGTTKFLFALPDGRHIESVLIPPATSFVNGDVAAADEPGRLTLCVSTQVGCALDCAFCATGIMGFTRNLTAGEIIDQVLQVRKVTSQPITNVVFMGMGEPLLNYDSVMNAAEIMTDGIGIAARHITISTAGRADRIRQMADEGRRPKLALSLHSAVNATRSRLMPINRKFDLTALRLALEHYYRQTRQRVTYEVILFDGVNDTDREVSRLITFARHVPSKVNIIPFHSIAFTGVHGHGDSLRPSPRSEEIVEKLRNAHVTVMVRSNAGEDIEGACGQLAVMAERRKKQQPG